MPILGVAWYGDDASMQDFVDRHGLTFPNMRDDTGELFARFGVPAQPAWVFISADGTVDTVFGALSDDQLADFLQRATGA